jgi:hypothetical protein
LLNIAKKEPQEERRADRLARQFGLAANLRTGTFFLYFSVFVLFISTKNAGTKNTRQMYGANHSGSPVDGMNSRDGDAQSRITAEAVARRSYGKLVAPLLRL